ncbi:MAG: type II secretion system secretin GspD [Candidatus Aureabacteria bacterium]|nr:type II secretion system secretin GspD [Candidatus Auribacterota bacterium]
MKTGVRSLVWVSAVLLGAACAITSLCAQEEKEQPRSSPSSRRREAQKQRKYPSPVPPLEPARRATAAPRSARTETLKEPEGAPAAPSKKERAAEEATPPSGKEATGEKTAAQGPEQVSEEELISLELDNVEIKYVIKLISDLTGKDYILSDQVRGTVTVMSPTKIPVDELPKVLESLLEVRGLATVPSGDFIKIVPRREGAKSPVEFESAEGIQDRAPDDTLVTQIVPLQYADLNEVQRLVTSLGGREVSVVPYPPTNTLIISDGISSLDRLMKIIKEVDIPGLESTITVVPCQYAAASLLAEEVLSIVTQKGAAPARGAAPRRRGKAPAQPAGPAGEEAIKLFADERTNSLIIVASPEDTERVLALVEELDRQTPESKTRVRVKRLSYSNSDDVASVLSSLTAARTGEGMPPVSVSSYPEINALVIDASPQDYDLLTRIIEDLDIPRDQVMVEVIVTEVDLGKSLSAEFQAQVLKGINYTPGENASGGQSWSGTEFGTSSLRSLVLDQVKNKTNYPLSAGSGLNYGYIYVPESDKNAIGPFSVLLNALEADTDINVLAAPQVLTCDNEEVSFNVADRVPILTSTLTTGSGTTGTDTIQQIDYRDVGTKIKLIPHISKDRFVRLEVDQSIESLVGVSLADITGPLTPATLKRETSTVVTVKDGHTVVISGMITDSYTTQESKVPILGDIPLVGLLARYRKNSISKVNLMVFITPRIVRNPTELALVTQKTRDRGDEFLEEAHGRPPRMLDRFIESGTQEPVKKLPAAGEAAKPYGVKK